MYTMTVRDGSQNVEFWVKITRFFSKQIRNGGNTVTTGVLKTNDEK